MLLEPTMRWEREMLLEPLTRWAAKWVFWYWLVFRRGPTMAYRLEKKSATRWVCLSGQS